MRSMLCSTLVIMSLAAPLSAQQKQIVPPTNRPRSGRAAAPAPPPQDTRATTTVPTYTIPTVVQPTYTVSAPSYVVQPDGSVLLNYGNGNERTLRRCAQDPYSSTYTLRPGSRGSPRGALPAMNVHACYRADAAGGVEVFGR
ncbi:MAG: hypothetical protein JWM95_1939 [Gemmatimonadetes bacterium]|nr:hypothetical protein [Gemmatimonadota bacterium]